ncbi:MAG: hypothetical protein AAGE96_19115 [Cyanobacteria bacterium P01_G01_bin.19]
MSFSERDLNSKLEEMEAEIGRETTPESQEFNPKPAFPQIEINPSPQVKGWLESGKAWFATLPQVGKAAVAIGGIWLGFSVVGAVLHVVSSVVTIGFVGLLVYVGYRLFKSN